MLTPRSSATDSGDDSDLAISQALEDNFPSHYNDFRKSNASTIPITSDYEFAETCGQFKLYDRPGQSASEHLMLEYEERKDQIESIYTSGIAKHMDDPHWQALGRCGTLSGFMAITLALAQRLTNEDESKLHKATQQASSTNSVPSRRSERVVKKSNGLQNKVSKPKKDSKQRTQSFATSSSRHELEHRKKLSQVYRKPDPKGFASMIRPVETDGHASQRKADGKGRDRS